MERLQNKINTFKYITLCPHKTTDNKNHINHLHGYKATSSASDVKCNTSTDKPVLSRVRRKRQADGSVKPLKNVLHFNIEAEGVEVHA